MPLALIDIVRTERAAADLRTYFDETLPRPYTGRRFEALGGGGDRPAVRDRITAADLVAVQMLSVTVPAEVAADLLDGRLGRQMSDLLPRIPTGVALGTANAADLVADGGPADQAWHLLKVQTGVDYVTAGKIMARKRPQLLPVYDQVIACLFGRPDHVWLRLHDCLTEDLRKELGALRDRAGVPAHVSLLRVLDVVLWMSHRATHAASACPGSGSVPLS